MILLHIVDLPLQANEHTHLSIVLSVLVAADTVQGNDSLLTLKN